MRQKLRLLLLAAIPIFLLSSCRKENSKDTVDNALVQKVNTWLDNQKVSSQPNKAANIDLLKANLDFSKLSIEKSGNEQIIIIPVKEGLRSAKKLDPNAIIDFVAIQDKNGLIRKGNIVLATSADGNVKGEVPTNTFYDIYNTSRVRWNSKFQFASVTGRRLYELQYKNGNLASAGIVQAKKKNSSNPNGKESVETCTDWYLVTTYYDAYGNEVDQTSEYLGQTCNDCDNTMEMSLCPDGSGGGGTDTEYEEERLKYDYYDWQISDIPDEFGSGVVDETLHVVAKFHKLHPENDAFDGAEPQNLQIRFNNWGPQSSGVFATSNTITNFTYPTKSTMTAVATGTIRFPDNNSYNYSGTGNFSLSSFSWH